MLVALRAVRVGATGFNFAGVAVGSLRAPRRWFPAMLHRLALQHVGPAERLAVEFSPRVNLITGDNGLGKSFLLDIAWWALTRTWAHYQARPDAVRDATPTISFSFGSEGKKDITYTSQFDWEQQAWLSKPGRPASPGMVLYAQVDGSFSVWDPARNYWKNAPTLGIDAPDRPSAYLFAPDKVWDGLERRDPSDPARTQWLCNGLIRDWASWQKENGAAFKQFCSVLAGLSPSPSEQLTPGRLTRISLGDNRDMPTLRMPYGKEVAIVHASAAIRRIAALAYLLVWTWQEHVRASELINRAPTRQIIFLIDEAEAHLHPAWQRRILRSLMDVMADLISSERVEVQVLVVTHSPLLLASMEPVFSRERDALWIFDLVAGSEGPEIQLRKDEWHRRGDASTWLRSIFGLAETRSIEAEAALTQADVLMRGPVPERALFEKHYDALRRALPGDDPFWVDWRAWAWRNGLLKGNQP